MAINHRHVTPGLPIRFNTSDVTGIFFIVEQSRHARKVFLAPAAQDQPVGLYF